MTDGRAPEPVPVPESPYQIPDGRDLGPERVFEDVRVRGLEGQRTEWRTELRAEWRTALRTESITEDR